RTPHTSVPFTRLDPASWSARDVVVRVRPGGRRFPRMRLAAAAIAGVDYLRLPAYGLSVCREDADELHGPGLPAVTAGCLTAVGKTRTAGGERNLREPEYVIPDRALRTRHIVSDDNDDELVAV